MPVVYQDSTNAISGGSAARPANTAAGDLLLAIVSTDTTITAAPTGWNLRASDPSGNGIITYVYTKTATSSEPTTYAWTPSGTAPSTITHVYRFTEASTTTAPTVAFGGSTTSSTSHSAPSVTGAANGELIFGFTATGGTTTWTTTAGTEREDANDAWLGLMTATLDLTADGATGTKTATASTSRAYRSFAVFVPSAGLVLTDTRADTLGGTDAASTSRGYVRPTGDTVVVSDTVAFRRTSDWSPAVSAAPTGDVSLTREDTATVADTAATTIESSRSSTDSATLDDTATAFRVVAPQNPTDTAAIGDAVGALLSGTYTVGDSAGVIDALTQQRTVQRIESDTVGITDSAAAAKSTSIGADTADLIDAVQTRLDARRSPADAIQGTDLAWLGGSGSRPVRSTAEVTATSSIGMRRTARLKAQTNIAFHTVLAGNLVKGPQRMPIEVTVTGNLQPVRPMVGEARPVIDFLRPQVRIVRSMTTAIRMTDEELAMQAVARRMTNVPEPEPVVEEDSDWLPEPVATSGPRRFSRSFETLRT